MSVKEFFINFFISFFSIFLGMLCTFVGQGMIDRATDRKDVRSALELVRSELIANIKDVGIMSEYLEQENKSAVYFLENRNNLNKCPKDSILYHSGIIFADASITLSHDALELLKMSSIFQKIGDSKLSMDIIRAYDTCESIVTNINRHISDREAQFDRSINEKSVSQFAPNGNIDILKYIKTAYGLYTLRWMSLQAAPFVYTDVSDIQAAVDAIDRYLAHKRLPKAPKRKKNQS